MDPVRAVEIAAARAWPATVTAGYRGWLLRSTPGVDRGRSNSALPPPRGARDLGDLDGICAWYTARGQRPRVMVSPLERNAGLYAELVARGWEPVVEVDVLTAALADVGQGIPPEDVTLRRLPDAEWVAAWADCEDRPQAAVQAEADRILARLGAELATPWPDPRTRRRGWGSR